uniref:Skin secretory protein xP2-like n=1 Tax=Castor canadensis TaxID=51338 RepID=A0A8B7WCJ3_CASCN|nr:skin secretory protein xP2-like [Castor canadensis]
MPPHPQTTETKQKLAAAGPGSSLAQLARGRKGVNGTEKTARSAVSGLGRRKRNRHVGIRAPQNKPKGQRPLPRAGATGRRGPFSFPRGVREGREVRGRGCRLTGFGSHLGRQASTPPPGRYSPRPPEAAGAGLRAREPVARGAEGRRGEAAGRRGAGGASWEIQQHGAKRPSPSRVRAAGDEASLTPRQGPRRTPQPGLLRHSLAGARSSRLSEGPCEEAAPAAAVASSSSSSPCPSLPSRPPQTAPARSPHCCPPARSRNAAPAMDRNYATSGFADPPPPPPAPPAAPAAASSAAAQPPAPAWAYEPRVPAAASSPSCSGRSSPSLKAR